MGKLSTQELASLLKEKAGGEVSPTIGVDISKMSLDQLLDLRHQIDERLPAKQLKDLNMEQELVIQYQVMKALQNKILHGGDDGTPTNQKTALLNACTAALQGLIKLQESVYTSERVKFIEAALDAALKGLPKPVVEDFMDRYTKALSGIV